MEMAAGRVEPDRLAGLGFLTAEVRLGLKRLPRKPRTLLHRSVRPTDLHQPHEDQLMRRPSPFRPLPHTEAPTRGLFIDRWGTLIDSDAACMEPKCGAWDFHPRAVNALFRAQQAGWLLYLIGNENGVASGRVEEQRWLEHERELLQRLAAQGVRVRRNYACLDHPAGKGAHRRPSVFLLPDTGVFYHAHQMDEVALECSWVVGDGSLELAAGERAGLNSAGVLTGRGMRDGELAVDPRMVAQDLAEFIGALLGPRVGAR